MGLSNILNWFRGGGDPSSVSSPPLFVEGSENLFFMGGVATFYEVGGPNWDDDIKKLPRLRISDEAFYFPGQRTVCFGGGVNLCTLQDFRSSRYFWCASLKNSSIKLNECNSSEKFCPLRLFYPKFMPSLRGIIADPITNSRIFRDLIEREEPSKLEACDNVLRYYLS